MDSCNATDTPASPEAKLEGSTNPGKMTKKYPYRELVGSLMYLAVGTRPDIAHTVSVLAQFNDKPSDHHWGAAKKVLRYLKGTQEYSLHFQRPIDKLEGYADSNWAGSTTDRRSYTGYVFLLGGAAISWQARKQKTVALSTAEAEYMALTEAAKESIFLNRFLEELGACGATNGTIFSDSKSAIAIAENPTHHSRTKHIDIRHHFIREKVLDGTLQLEHVPSDEMLADIFTKPLKAIKHSRNCENLGLM